MIQRCRVIVNEGNAWINYLEWKSRSNNLFVLQQQDRRMFLSYFVYDRTWWGYLLYSLSIKKSIVNSAANQIAAGFVANQVVAFVGERQ